MTGPRTGLRGLLLTAVLAGVAASGIAEESHRPAAPSAEAWILERLEAKGIPPADLPAPSPEDPAAWRLALARLYVERLGVGDHLRDAQRGFAPGGAWARRVPGVREQAQEAARFLARPADRLAQDAEQVPRHADLLRAAWAVLPLVVEPEAPGPGDTWRVAPPARWLLLQVAPDLKPAAEASFARPEAPLRGFLESDALRAWLDATVAANAKSTAAAFWGKALERMPDTVPLKAQLNSTLLPFVSVSLRTLFGDRWDRVTRARGLDLVPWALLAVSLTRRGRAFLEEFLPLVAEGRIAFEPHESPTSTGQYQDGRLAVDFGKSPACTIDTLMHEGVHAVDDLLNGRAPWWKEVRRRARAERAGLRRLANEASRAGDDLALEQAALRLAGLEAHVAALSVADQAETEFLAWHATTEHDGEVLFLVVTEAMVREDYVLDRDRLEDRLVRGTSYRMDSRIVAEVLRARDWDAMADIRRSPDWKTYPVPDQAIVLDSAEGWRRLGDAYRVFSLPGPALLAYDRSLAADRGNAGAHAGRGWVHAQQGAHELALVAYGRAVAADPADADVLVDRGQAFERLGANRQALSDYTRAIEVSGGEDEDAWMARGRLRLGRGEVAEGLEDLTRVVRLAPDWAAGWLARAQGFRAAGDREKARADLDRALAQDASFVTARIERADLRLEEGVLDGALEDADRAVHDAPGLARAYEVRARILDALGRAAEAEADRARAAALP